MKTYIECIPCFFRQAIEAADVIGVSDKKKKEIINQIAHSIPAFPLTATPPEMGQIIYKIVRTVTGNKDPYLSLKQKSHEQTMNKYGLFMNKINKSRNKLLTAVELAIAGNIIDFGVKNSLNIQAEIEKILHREEREIKNENEKCFQYTLFIKKLAAAHKILYLADNVGETVFDKILLEQIKKKYPEKEICYAVRGFPVLNDALETDAYNAEINNYARIINNGYDAPGTILKKSSIAFQKTFKAADLIISKGQGNFESLSGKKGYPVFFLFMVKCPIVAKHLDCEVGNIILKYNKGLK
ncbi:MAG: DUF89 family protein [Deltaproteobacteria bacterium]|nr:DUF89 family protein [Deltaproteobacteria bacterium]